MQALERMGTYMSSLKAFSLTADDTIDQVLESGQKIQLSSTIDLQVRKPNGLRADIDTDHKSL